MTSPRTKSKVPPVDKPAENGSTPVDPPLPKGSQRAAARRAQRQAAAAQATDPLGQLQLQYQQLLGQAQQLERDKAIAQRAAELSDTLLTEARNQLAQLTANIQLVVEQNVTLTAELDGLYDEHPELVLSDTE